MIGEVIEVREGAAYLGTLYDQEIVVRTSDGSLLTLFDMTPMIARGIRTGQRLEAVVAVAVPGELRRGDRATIAGTAGHLVRAEWEGFRDDLLSRAWCLLAAADGYFLIAASELAEAALGEGDHITWTDARFDLMAWRRRPPSPASLERGAGG